MDQHVDYVKETSVGNCFNVRFHSGGRVLEWPIDGDISMAWEGVFFAGDPDNHPWEMATAIGNAVTRYVQHPRKRALIGLEIPEPPGEPTQSVLRPVEHENTGLQWFQGRARDES